jgi:dUTP pyrophosphatase
MSCDILNDRIHSLSNPEKKDRKIKIPPKCSILVPTGIKVIIPVGYELKVENKSGISHKRQLLVGACIVDPDYRGEIFVNLHNVGEEWQEFEDGEKVAQCVIRKIENSIPIEIPLETYNKFVTDRGDGGFGSTGNV